MCTHEQVRCPRCNAGFECKVGSILLCQCTVVPLSIEERSFISDRYDDCLCANCMREMKKAYHRYLLEQKLNQISTLFKDKP